MAKARIKSGAGYWMIPAPSGYKGKVYSKGLIYEHRYVLEQKLGRKLTSNEIAHHLNGNPLDNKPENLVVRTRGQHRRDHNAGIQMLELKCPACGTVFTRQKRRTHVSKKGFFTACSSKCRGKFSSLLQHHGTDTAKRALAENIIREYRAPVAQLD